MKDKRIKILALITVLTVTASAIVSIVFKRAEQPKQVPAVSSNVSTAAQKYKYTVREYNGKLAVFEYGENKPFRITDLDVAMLPQSDRTLLAVGIQVKNNRELNRILEDFCS